MGPPARKMLDRYGADAGHSFAHTPVVSSVDVVSSPRMSVNIRKQREIELKELRLPFDGTSIVGAVDDGLGCPVSP